MYSRFTFRVVLNMQLDRGKPSSPFSTLTSENPLNIRTPVITGAQPDGGPGHKLIKYHLLPAYTVQKQILSCEGIPPETCPVRHSLAE